MIKNIFLLLGLPEGASTMEIEQAYQEMMQAMSNSDCQCGHDDRVSLEAARQQLQKSYEHHMMPQTQEAYAPRQSPPELQSPPASKDPYCRPKLGQLLVASGLINLEELDAVLAIQRNTGHEHIPLGQFLVAAGYITAQQLDYYLRVQNTLQLPSDHPSRWGQRLIEMGLIDDDKLKTALLEQQATACTLRQALINRGWLAAETLDRIF